MYEMTTCMKKSQCLRVPDKTRICIPKMPISSLNPMFDHLLEPFCQDDSNKWSNIGFGEEITCVVSIEVHFTHVIWSSELTHVYFEMHLYLSEKRDH